MFKQLLCIFFTDTINIKFHQFINNYIYIDFNEKARWFLLHGIINIIIVYYSLSDLSQCYKNPKECYKITWNDNSINVYNYACMLHIYHCILFILTKADYIHHFLMVLICGVLSYTLQSIIISFALFFLTGLPGAIDYILLYLVKINRLSTLKEKQIYLYLSLFIRTPGCVCTAFIGSYGLIDYFNNKNYYYFMILLLNLLLIFWNGQYYLLSCYKSYLDKCHQESLNN